MKVAESTNEKGLGHGQALEMVAGVGFEPTTFRL